MSTGQHFTVPLIFWLSHSSTPHHSSMVPKPGVGGLIQVSFSQRNTDSHDSYSTSNSNASLISHNKELLWARLGEARIYGQNQKYLEGSLTSWLFRKTSLGSPQGPVTSLAMGLKCQAWVLLCCWPHTQSKECSCTRRCTSSSSCLPGPIAARVSSSWCDHPYLSFPLLCML